MTSLSAATTRSPNVVPRALTAEIDQVTEPATEKAPASQEASTAYEISRESAQRPAPVGQAGSSVAALMLADRGGTAIAFEQSTGTTEPATPSFAPPAITAAPGQDTSASSVEGASAVKDAQPSEADVEAFVRDWFSKIDRKAPEGELLKDLFDEGLTFKIPGITLRSHKDFKRTYGLLNFLLGDRSVHEIEEVSAKRIGPNTFEARNVHRWRMKVFNFLPITQHLDETWKVEVKDGKLRIKEYLGGFA